MQTAPHIVSTPRKATSNLNKELNSPRKCSRSRAIDKLVCILSCSRCARSQTSPRPLQQSTAIPRSNSMIPFRYSSMAISFWPANERKKQKFRECCSLLMDHLIGKMCRKSLKWNDKLEGGWHWTSSWSCCRCWLPLSHSLFTVSLRRVGHQQKQKFPFRY